MKKISALFLISLSALVSCNSRPEGVSAADDRASQAQAVANAGCIIEDQKVCTELVAKRGIVGQFFSPVTTSTLKKADQEHGVRVLTRRIVDAVSAIRQCTKTEAKTIPLIQKLVIAGEEFSFLATAPVTAESSCFISRLEG